MKPEKLPVIGDCEACILESGKNTELFPSFQGMMICAGCVALQNNLVKDSNRVIDAAQQIDNSIQTKEDIFTAVTVPFIELEAAVNNNPSLSPIQKRNKMAELTAARIKKNNNLIFALKAENSSLSGNMQALVSRLDAIERTKYAEFDINYTPAKVKKTKTVSVPTNSASALKRNELQAASEKYNVDMTTIRTGMLQFNISADESAKRAAELGMTRD